jgi:putative ABC transport system permease protein
MTLSGLAWRNLWARPLSSALNLMLLALGVALVVFLLLVGEQVERSLQRDLAGIDLVVGAKGSPMQLMLAGVFHLDVPTGNIALDTLDQVRAQPMVRQALPLALGDSIKGFRIVGTEAEYLDWYGAALADGRRWQAPMEAVVGDAVAHELSISLGGRLAGSHGLGGDDQAHAAMPYTVVGRLQRCGCVLDRLVLTALQSVWAVHEHGEARSAAPAAADEPREVTLLLLRYKSPLAATTMPRWVNAQSGLQAAAPALETARLFRLVGIGVDVLRGFAALLLAVSLLSVFVALLHAVREREADLAMMRMLGAPPRRLAALIACEALWLAAMGAAAGTLLGHALAHALGIVLARQRSLPISGGYWTSDELWCIVAVLVLALLAAAIPAWRARQLEVARLLQAAR